MLFLRVFDTIPRHEHDLADSVGAGRFCVGHGRLRRAPLIADRQHVHDLLRLRHNVLGYAGDANSALRVIAQVQVRVLAVWEEQVANDLVVDLHVRHLEADVLVSLRLDGHEEVFKDEDHDAWLVNVPSHRVGLARTSRTIGENAGVVAVNNGRDQLRARARIDVCSADSLIENSIKEVPLLARPMQDIGLLVVLFIFHVHFVEDNDELVLWLNDFKVFRLDLFVGHRTHSHGDHHV